ncbi:hypothetical protein ABH935_008021 [Catenulispora sp. GAS73]
MRPISPAASRAYVSLVSVVPTVLYTMHVLLPRMREGFGLGHG